jgi:hypothetical protein
MRTAAPHWRWPAPLAVRLARVLLVSFAC